MWGPGDPHGPGLSPVLGVDLTSSRERSVRSGSRRSRGRKIIILVWAGLWVLRLPARGGSGPGHPLCPQVRGVHAGGTGWGVRRGMKGSQVGLRWLGTPTCTCSFRGPGTHLPVNHPQHRLPARDPSTCSPAQNLPSPPLIFLFLLLLS